MGTRLNLQSKLEELLSTFVELISKDAVGLAPATLTGVVLTSQENEPASGLSFTVYLS